jgi:2-iminobutanoate/2-iminopropanoate deaminase
LIQRKVDDTFRNRGTSSEKNNVSWRENNDSNCWEAVLQPRNAWLTAAMIIAAGTLGACSSTGETTLGGRPLIYKQGPGDNPSTIESRAGIVGKRDEPAPAPSPSAAAPRPAPAPAPARVAQAAPAPVAPTPPIAPTAPPARDRASGDAFGGYTQAIRYGDLLFLSGQIAIDPATGAFASGQNARAQTQRVLENIRAVLEANRLTMANVVSTTVYLRNISDLAAMDEVYHDFFRSTPPARTVVEVSNLPRGALVEISVIAGR